MLALFALLLSIIANVMLAPSDAFGILAGDQASRCSPGGAPPNDHEPGLPGAHHNCPCCLTQQLNWAAIVPAPAAIAVPFFVAAAASIASEQPSIVARPRTDSRPRAPPFPA